MRITALLLSIHVLLVTPIGAQDADKALPQLNGLSLVDLLSEPVSAASRYEQSAREAPASVSVISADEIRQFGATTLLEALEQLPGIFSSDDHNYAYLGIRGMLRPSDYNNRVLMLIDGVPTNEAAWGSTQLGYDQPIPLDAVERIELARGPGSAVYGGNAMLAVVNVVTKTAASFEGARASITAGSLGYEGVTASFSRELGLGTEVLASVELEREEGRDFYWPELDDPGTNFGRAEGLDRMDRQAIYARLRRGDLSLIASHSRYDKAIPTGAWDVLLDDDGTRSVDRVSYLAASNTWDADPAFAVTADLGLYEYEGDGSYMYDQPTGLFEERSKARWMRANVRAQWDRDSRTRFLLGVEAQNEFETSFYIADEEGIYQDIDIPHRWGGLFGQVERQIARSVGLALGLRYDTHSAGYSGLSPRASLVLHPGDSHTLKLLFGTAFRAPAAWEHSYDDGIFYEANPDLDQERIRSAELWWEAALGSSTFLQASVYNYWLEDLIDEVWNEETELASFDNADELEARGVELRLRGEVGDAWNWFLSGALQDAHASSLGAAGLDAQLPNSPASQLRAGLHYRLASGPYVSGVLKAEGPRSTVYEEELDGFWVANATLGLPSVAGKLGVRLVVSNLFDREYFLPGGWEHAQTGLIQDGRTARIALIWNH